MKKAIALLLALALTLTLAVPAFADGFDLHSLTEKDLTITAPDYRTAKVGDVFTVEIGIPADLPADVEVSYRWTYKTGSGSADIPGTTGPVLTVRPGDSYYPTAETPLKEPYSYHNYSCIVTFAQEDGEGQLQSVNVRRWIEVYLLPEWTPLFADPPQKTVAVPYGATVVVDATVNVPADVVVAYEWWVEPLGLFEKGTKVPIKGAAGPVLTLRPGDEHYPEESKLTPYFGAAGTYYFEITFTVPGKDGGPAATCTYSGSCTRTVEPRREMNGIERLFWVYTYAPLAMSFQMTIMSVAMSFGGLLIVSPVIFVVGWVRYLIQVIKYGEEAIW